MRNGFVLAAGIALAATGALAVSVGAAQAKDFFKMGSLAPGMSPFTVNTAFATIINKHLKDVEIQVSATGSGMRHQLLAAKGRMDFFMSSPIGQLLMEKQIGPFKKLKNGKELSGKLRHIFTYEIGPYHFVTYADSGIMKIADLKGKKVFIGPPGGAATRNVGVMIKSQTGMVAGKDFEKINMGWSAAIQAFQDKKYDVMVIPTNAPSPAIQQIALNNKLRLLSVDISKQGRLLRTPGRTIRTIDPTVYGPNMVTRMPVTTLGALVGIGVRADMPDDVVYKITKAFWENINDAHATASWMKNAVNLDVALVVVPHGLHPGAARYYKERGMKIPAAFKTGQKWNAKSMTFKTTK